MTRAPLDDPDLEESIPEFDPALLLRMLTGNITLAEKPTESGLAHEAPGHLSRSAKVF
jgi:hypothetical protein